MFPRLLPMIAVVVLTRVSSEACTGPRNEAELREALFGKSTAYNAFVRPSVELASYSMAAPELVAAQLYVHDLFDVDQKRGMMTIQAKQYSVWKDARLAWNGTDNGGCLDEVDFPGELLSEMWRPDLFWLGLSEPEKQLRHYFKLRSDGRVLDNKLLYMKLRCEMDLGDMPYDEQTCTIRLGTYRENLKQVRLVFKDTIPIRMDSDVNNLEFELTAVSGTNPITEFSTGKEARLDFSFHFRRKPAFYEQYYFKPLGVIVMVSWMQFFVDRNAVPARATLALVCLLTCVFASQNLLKNIPAVPYSVFAVNFINVCEAFQIYGIVAFALGNYLCRVQKRVDAGKPAGRLYCCLRRNGTMTLKDEHVDLFSRIAYPIAFATAMAILFLSRS